MKRSLLSASIKKNLGLTAAAILLPSMPALAQEDVALVEEVIVTGSRIKRTNFDEAAQVVSIGRTDIEALGDLTIADTLRNTPLNAFGSFNERSGSSAQSNATVDLRGLGSERSLVMLNGRRLPGSPNLGAASVNLNMIPMAAVERVDILADGASAVYGSDAVAGVVNLVMRENFDGVEFSARRGDRANDDGIEESFSFLAGMSGERGNITFAAEYDHRDAIFDRDRDYTSAWVRDTNGDGRLDLDVDTNGVSPAGKTITLSDKTTGYSRTLAANGCPSTGDFVGELGDPSPDDPLATVCGYSSANISTNKAELSRVNTFINANYELSENVEFFTNILFSKVDSFGRYAPPAEKWKNMPADYKDVPFDIDALLADGTISEDYELTGNYRWDNIGPRDNYVTDTQFDLTLGLRGDIAGSGVNYETYAQTGRYESKEIGNNYLYIPGITYELEKGGDPLSAEAGDTLRATPTQDNYTKMSKVYGHLQFDTIDLFGAGDIIVLAGAEAYTIDYANRYDAPSEAELIGGSAGNSSSGDRDVQAIFAEAIIPVISNLEVNAAVRYDNYSDFGSNVAPSLSATYRVTDSLMLRARAGKGFRAPALSELYGPTAFSAEYAKDPRTGQNKQFDTHISSNEDLDAETSTSLSFGGNWAFMEGWALDVGFWNVEVKDVIVTPSAQSIFYAQASGIQLNPANGIYTEDTLPRPTFYTQPTNAGLLDVTGVDIKLDGNIDTQFGNFTIGGMISHQLSYKEDAYYQGPVQNLSGFNLRPDLRAQARFGWNMGMHNIDLTVDYLGAHDESDVVSNSGKLLKSGEDLDSWTTLNLAYRIDVESFGAIKVGARNLTNEDPVFDSNGKFIRDHYNLYDNTGRTVYAEYVVSF